ncbi:MAG: hypothetical protein ACLFTL_09485 [Alphaproteobacteria bacterium]
MGAQPANQVSRSGFAGTSKLAGSGIRAHRRRPLEPPRRGPAADQQSAAAGLQAQPVAPDGEGEHRRGQPDDGGHRREGERDDEEGRRAGGHGAPPPRDRWLGLALEDAQQAVADGEQAVTPRWDGPARTVSLRRGSC